MSASIETYRDAEDALISWVDTCTKNNLSIPEIAFLLQFRIYDINYMARVPITPKVDNESTNNPV